MSAPKKEAFEEYIATLMDSSVDLVSGLPLNAKEEGLAAISVSYTHLTLPTTPYV